MSGLCDWHECANEAGYALRDLVVTMKGGTKEINVGKIYLCPRHFLFSRRTGRVNLPPEIIVWALEDDEEE